MTLIDDLPDRIEASFIGALAGEQAAGTAAGTADLVGVAESASACGCFDDADLRQRGLERPSRAGAAGLLLRALPFGLLSPSTGRDSAATPTAASPWPAPTRAPR